MGIATIVFPWCQKVLPLTYDESLSYYECVCKLIGKTNEIIEHLEGYDEVIRQLQEALTDLDTMKADIEVLKGDVTRIDTDILDLRTAVNSIDVYVKNMETRFDERLKEDEDSIAKLAQIIANINTNFDNKIESLRNELTTLFNSFTADFTEELAMLQLKVNQMKVNLQSQIDELKRAVSEIDTSVVNPWHYELGKISPQKNVNLCYRDLADRVPQASQYSMVGLSADEYSALGMSAMDYVEVARKKLHLHWKFSPVFGWRQEINNVLTSIVDWLCDTMTANVYAEMDITADEYVNLNLTAHDYYKFSPERVGLYVRDGVLQSEQYILAEEDGVLSVLGATSVETDGVFEIT